MTTVVYKDGVLCADTLVTWAKDGSFCKKMQKVVAVNGRVYGNSKPVVAVGFAGNGDYAESLINVIKNSDVIHSDIMCYGEWFAHKEKLARTNLTMLAVHDDLSATIMHCGEEPYCLTEAACGQFAAIGSGANHYSKYSEIIEMCQLDAVDSFAVLASKDKSSNLEINIIDCRTKITTKKKISKLMFKFKLLWLVLTKMLRTAIKSTG